LELFADSVLVLMLYVLLMGMGLFFMITTDRLVTMIDKVDSKRPPFLRSVPQRNRAMSDHVFL